MVRLARIGSRARARITLAAVVFGATSVFVASCGHDWAAYDPRLGSDPQDASSDPDGSAEDADSGGPDASADADAQTPDADAGSDGDAGPVHVTDGLLVLYTFDEGSGTSVGDTSGLGAPLDLAIADGANVQWIPGALEIVAPTIISSNGPATKVIQGCQATNEITMEVWFSPANLDQGGPARLITNSIDTGFRNFQLGQEQGSYYQARLRSTVSTENGSPFTQTPADAGDATLALTHLLFTRDTAGARHFYVDGVERATDRVAGDFSNWNPAYGLALANEFTLDRTWLGQLHRVAVYDRALTPAEVAQNFAAGP